MRPVVLLAAGEPVSDPRVWRCARALADRGRPVVVVAQVEGGSGVVRDDVIDGARIRRVPVGGVTRPLRALAARRPGASTRGGERGPVERQALQGVSSAAFGVARAGWRGRALVKAASGLMPALVHAHDEATWPAGLAIARRARCSVVLDAHEIPAESRHDWGHVASAIQARWVGPLIRRADAVITVNDHIADRIASRYGVARPAVVWNCPPLTPRPADPPSNGGPLRVLHHGLLDHARGLEAFLEGAARVPGVELRIRGDGRAMELLREIALRGGLDPDQVFLGRIPMAELVRQAAGFHVGAVTYPPVSMNHALASPNKLFEYMMAGLCVVATDLPVLRAVVDGARAGRLVRPTADDWARCLRELVADRAFVTQAGRRARAAAERRWSWERQSEVLLDVYARLAADA